MVRSLVRLGGSIAIVVACFMLSSSQVQANDVCGDYYNQGGCGCSGWITVNFPYGEGGSCEDTWDCAVNICVAECGQYSSPWSFGSCGSNEWSEWMGFKCDPFPCND